MPAKTERRHQQGEESRERILDATIEIAAERGYEGTSMSMISKRSGLPVSSIYWHFASKDELLAAVIRRSFDAWVQTAATWADPQPGVSPRDRLAAMRTHAMGLREHPDFLRLGLMLSLERRPDEPTARALFLEVRERTFRGLVHSYEHLFADAGVDPGPVARRLARLTMATADGLFVAHQIDPEGADLEGTLDLFGAMVEQVLDAALGPQAPRP